MVNEASQENLIRARVEELMKANKNRTEIAQTLKKEGIVSKRTGKPLAEGSVNYYMKKGPKATGKGGRPRTITSATVTTTSGVAQRRESVVEAIRFLAQKLRPHDQRQLGYEFLVGKL